MQNVGKPGYERTLYSLHPADDALQHLMEYFLLNYICLRQLQIQAVSLGIQCSLPICIMLIQSFSHESLLIVSCFQACIINISNIKVITT